MRRDNPGLSIEGIPERIAELEAVSQAAEGGDKERLMNRIAELQELQSQLEKQNIVIINSDNKQIQQNNQGNTVSIGKETKPNDQTMQEYQRAAFAN